jgi:hypothetical protein
MTEQVRQPLDRWDLALFLLALIGVSLTASAAFGVVTLGLIAWATGDMEAAEAGAAAASGIIFVCLLGLPALVNAGRRVLGGRLAPPDTPSAWLYALGLLFPAGLLMDWLAFERGVLTPVLGPAGQSLAVLAPAAVLLVMVRRRGPSLRPRRAWGHFLLGLWLVPVIALLLEGVLLLAAIAIAAGLLSLSASGQALLEAWQGLLTQASGLPVEPPADLVGELALHPVVIGVLVAMLSLLVPIIEESLKTASIWPLLPARIRGAPAFLGGVLGGTGFALSEGLFLAQPTTGWLLVLVGRAGATLMHAFATGLAAWALAELVVGGRWRRGLAGFASAVVMHGLWNGAAIAVGLSQLAAGDGGAAPANTAVTVVGASLILGLTSVAVIGLPTFLGALQRHEPTSRA